MLMALVQSLAEGLDAAVQDLIQKSVSHMQEHYGEVEYVLAYAASGAEVSMHIITIDGQVSAHMLQGWPSEVETWQPYCCSKLLL